MAEVGRSWANNTQQRRVEMVGLERERKLGLGNKGEGEKGENWVGRILRFSNAL